jgi:hypothetical protein
MASNQKCGTRFYNPSKAYNGYTLFTPWNGTQAWLVDMRGNIVHWWETNYRPGLHGMLLPNGNLLYGGRMPDAPLIPEIGGGGGVLIEFDWNGKEVWRYEDPYMHHDFWRMGNGNTMVLRFDAVPDDIGSRVKGGIPGTERKGVIWTDSFREVDPNGKIVWEWYFYDHLDPDTDIICPLCNRAEWTHCNACKINAEGDILTTSHTLNSVFLIDKVSGNIKWQWGKAELAHPHDPSFLDNGNILIYDNGLHRAATYISYSRIVEVERATGEISWEYADANPCQFYSSFISGCERLPNGNTLICEGAKGRFFEVTSDKEVVWEYISPFFYQDPGIVGYISQIGLSNLVFRAHRYAPDFPAFRGVVFDPSKFEYWNQIYGEPGLSR